ncbi:MAG: biosynthetic arginine decarboxylase [Deltaproteobacteria bacterium]|nr:biosynthetic arginine decarboxylase [Deltaproteobacteria bacterium]
MERWTIANSNDLYRVDSWGGGYFSINQKGNISVRPSRNGASCDLHELVSSLVKRGIEAPILVRFDGIIEDRVRFIQAAFDEAIKDNSYGGSYRITFPIKVNQQRHVVDTVRLAGRENCLGLEVGSKPELLAVLAIHDTPGALLLCNGYKDTEYIGLALLGRKIGRRSIIIVEQLYELQMILDLSQQLGIEAEIGLRMKPTTKGSGRWESSSGDNAKFGLNTTEIVAALNKLKEAGKTDWLKLLHFHIGSQITSISSIKQVLRETTRMYVEIAKICPSLTMLDVGGGLGVDYDGSRSNFESSMNYTVGEYARDVVAAIDEACRAAEVPHPDIISESGRAIVAHHSVLVTEALDVSPVLGVLADLGEVPGDHELLSRLREMYNDLSIKNLHETWNDALDLRDQILELFIRGDITLEERAYAERGLKHLTAKIKSLSANLKYVPEELERVDAEMRDLYFCNFSVFQSLPDSWAVDQLFPIMPIHRLDVEPKRRAFMADLSCDSDGKIDRFIDLRDVNSYIRLHELDNGHPYYIGIFLVGAYQEILGDLHNLFGDTNAVHVTVDHEGNVELNHVVQGDTVREVLRYVQYEPQDLFDRLRISIERSLKNGNLSPEESAKLQKRYREALEGYTYLVK